MKLILAKPGEGYGIQAYKTGQVSINGQTYSNSLILTPSQLMADWRPQSVEELTEADFAPLEELRPNLVLLGTGKKQIFPPLPLYAPLLQKGIAVEVMNTAAACRTFNILAAEGRQVAAALMMV